MPLHGPMQIRQRHHHPRVALTQESLEACAVVDKRRKQQAHQLGFVQPDVALQFKGRPCPLLSKCQRAAKCFHRLIAQAFRQLFTAHHHQGPLQIYAYTLFIGTPLHETGVQPSHVCADRETAVVIVTKVSCEFVRLVTEKLGQQGPSLFQFADQQVVNINQRCAAAGFKVFRRAPGLAARLRIKALITMSAKVVNQGEQSFIAGGVMPGSVMAGLCSSPFQAFDKSFFLARCVVADKGVDAMFPASNLSIELTGGQVAVVPQVKWSIHGPHMANHQQVGALGLAALHGHRRQGVKRQDLAVIDHQHFNPRIVVDEQGAVGAMNVFQGHRAGAAQTQGCHA
ncbi:hypothetical protein D3C87_1302520 [compost metagenome]